MAKTTGDVIVEKLLGWGVDTAFGIPAWSDETVSMKFVKGHTSASWRPPIRTPQMETIRTAAELLNEGKKVVILAGQGALGATDELEKIADVCAFTPASRSVD